MLLMLVEMGSIIENSVFPCMVGYIRDIDGGKSEQLLYIRA